MVGLLCIHDRYDLLCGLEHGVSWADINSFAGWVGCIVEGGKITFFRRNCDDRAVDDGCYIIQAMQAFMMKDCSW